MSEHDDNYRRKIEDRDSSDANAFFGGGPQPAPAPAAPAAPAPAAPAAPTGGAPRAVLQRTAPTPEAPQGFEFYGPEETPSPNVEAAPPPPAPTAETGAATTAAPPGAPAPAPAGAPAPAIPPVTPAPATGVATGEQSLVAKPQEPVSRSFPDALKAVAKDVGWGMVEAIPQYAIGGRIDFYSHLLGLTTDLAKGMEKVLPPGMFSESVADREDAMKTMREQYGQPALSDFFNNIINEPTTNTGKFFRKFGEFMRGYRLPYGMMTEAGVGGMKAATAAAAISGFVGTAPDEEGLANLLKDNLPKPLGDALAPLAVNPNDPAIVNRARHALEQAGLGVVAEGIVNGVQAFRAHRVAAATAKSLTPEAQAAAQAEVEQAASLVKSAAPAADAQAPLFTLVEQPSKEALAANKLQDVKVAVEPGVPGSVLGEAIARGQTLPELKLNYANMTKENIPDMAQQIGASIIERISAAKRGVLKNDLVRSMANKLGMTPEDLLARQGGEAWSAEKIYGAAALIGQADKDLRALAEIARQPGSSVADGFALRRQLTYYAAMMENFMGVAGEAGRSLQIFKNIHATGVLRQARAIQAVIEKAGGIENTRALAEVIATADEYSLSMAAKKGWTATGAEAIRTVQVMSLMFRPATQIRNIVGNMLMLPQLAADVHWASRIGWLMGTTADQAITQAGVAGYIEAHYYGFKNALSSAGKSLMTGTSQFAERVGIPGGGTTAATAERGAASDLSASQRLGAEMRMSDMQIQQFTDSGFGKAIDWIASATTLPGRFLTAGDDFFKSIIYTAKARQGAIDQAVRDGLTGRQFEDQVIRDTLNPPDHIHLDAFDWAMWGTFNNKAGPITDAAMKLRDGIGPASYLVFPFMRTPGNIASMFIQHSPLALVTRAFYRDVFVNGGVDRDIALAKMAVGSGILATTIAWAEAGMLTSTDAIDPKVAKEIGSHITGSLPDKPELADAYIGLGLQKYALRVGDKWIAVSGMGPYAFVMGYATALNEIWRTKDIRPQEYVRWQQNVGHAVAAVYSSMKDQSYFEGFSSLSHALDEAAKGNETSIERWFNQVMGQATINAVPFLGGMMTSTQKLWDPDQSSRNIFSYWDAVKQHMIGLTDTVSPVRDASGEIMPPPTWSGDKFGRFYDYFMPFPITQFKPSPIREELVRLQSGIKRIDKVTDFDGVKVDFRNFPEVFDMYQRLAGNELKHPATGLGMWDTLSAIVSGKNPAFAAQHQAYQTMTDSYGEVHPGTKMAYLQTIVAEFKQRAQNQIMADAGRPEASLNFQEFAQKVRDEKQRVRTFETGRAGIIAPIEDWANKIGMQPPLATDYSRPKRQPNGGDAKPSF